MNQSESGNSSAQAILPAVNTVAFGTIVFVLLFINMLFTTTTIFILFKSAALNKYIKIVLINILIAILFLNVNLLLPTILVLVLTNESISAVHIPIVLCRLLAWGITVGVDVRLHCLAVFAIMIWLMIKRGRQSFTFISIAGMVVTPWILPALTRFYVFVPRLYTVEYHDSVLCFEADAKSDVNVLHTLRVILGSLFTIINNIIPLVVSIAAAVITVCHAKRTTLMKEDKATVNDGLARLVVLLIIGNSVNYAGILIVGIVQSILKFQQLSVYFTYIFACLYLYPTPIFVWVYLKPVQRQVKASLKKYWTKPKTETSDLNSAQTLSSI